MATPVSIPKSKWTSCDGFSSNIFKDDFVHDNQLTWKLKSVSTNGATVNYKQNLNYVKSLETKDELKFWFPWENRFVYTRVDNNSVKLHLDNGVTLVKGRKFNFYGSFGFMRALSSYNFKVGATHLHEVCTSDNRLRLDHEQKLTWYHKTLVKHNEFRFGVHAVADLVAKNLIKKDLFLGYLKNQYEAYLKFEQDWKHPTTNWADLKQYFTNLNFTAVYKYDNKETFALEASLNPSNFALNHAAFLVDYRHNFRSSFKVKLDTHTNLSVVHKHKLNDQCTVGLGTSFGLTERSKNQLKYGVELNLSV